MNASPIVTSSGRRTYEISHCAGCLAPINRQVFDAGRKTEAVGPWIHNASNEEPCQ